MGNQESKQQTGFDTVKLNTACDFTGKNLPSALETVRQTKPEANAEKLQFRTKFKPINKNDLHTYHVSLPEVMETTEASIGRQDAVDLKVDLSPEYPILRQSETSVVVKSEMSQVSTKGHVKLQRPVVIPPLQLYPDDYSKSSDIIQPTSTTKQSDETAVLTERSLQQRSAKRAQKRIKQMTDGHQHTDNSTATETDCPDDDLSSQGSQFLSVYTHSSQVSGNSHLTPSQVMEKAQQMRIRRRQSRHRNPCADQEGPGLSSARRLLEDEEVIVNENHKTVHDSNNLVKYMKMNRNNELLPLDYSLGFQEQLAKREYDDYDHSQRVPQDGLSPMRTAEKSSKERHRNIKPESYSVQQRYPWMNESLQNSMMNNNIKPTAGGDSAGSGGKELDEVHSRDQFPTWH
jgi:hypothetical protein